MKKVVKYLQYIENTVMVIAFSIMVITSFLQVLNRNFIQSSIPWLEESAIFCMVYMVLIGTEVGLRDGTQIAVSSVVERFGGTSRKVIDIISKTIVVLFSLIILWGAVNIVDLQIQTQQVSAALRLPMSIPYFALVLSFAIISVVQFVELITLIRHKPIVNSQEGN